jgi:hypothetical protein
MRERLSFILFVCIMLSVSIGCSLKGKKDRWQPVLQKKTPVVHIVQYPKETFPIISTWYTGGIKHLESLIDANPNINPDHLLFGNEIFIPEHLVKTRESMPKEFISKYYQEQKKKKAPTKSARVPGKKTSSLPEAIDEDEFEIFGPK